MVPDSAAGWARLSWDGLLFGTLVLVVGCATSSSTNNDSDKARRALTSGYEVREATTGGQDTSPMTVQSEHGFLGQEEANDAINRRVREMVRCYAEAGEAQGFAGGRVHLHFVVDVSGRPKSVHVKESQLGNFDVERCLVNIARGITFPRPQGGEATVDYSLEFRSTGEHTVVDVPSDEMLPAVPALLRQLAADCQRLGAPEVTATIYVGVSGSVRSVGFAAATEMDIDVMACASRTMRAWSVPATSTLGGSGLGRTTLALRNDDVLNPPSPPARRAATRLTLRRTKRR